MIRRSPAPQPVRERPHARRCRAHQAHRPGAVLPRGVGFGGIGRPGARGYAVYLDCFERGLLVRQTGGITVLSPPLVVERPHIDQMFGTLADALRNQR